MARRDGGPRHQHLRRRVAHEAARLLAESGGDDFAWARRKAATRLGVRDESLLPDGAEILEALRDHRALFGGGERSTRAAASMRRWRRWNSSSSWSRDWST